MRRGSVIWGGRGAAFGASSVAWAAALALVAAVGCEPRDPVNSPTPTPVSPRSEARTPAPAVSPKPSTSANASPQSAPSAVPSVNPSPAVGSRKGGPGSSPAPAGKRVEYAPHITIDYSVPQVEIDAHVVLREGLLELLLCADNSKEHESILATAARPRQVFEAIGIIGVAPGQPPQADPQSGKTLPAAGDPLTIEIRIEGKDGRKSVAPQDWLLSADDKPVPPQHWLFLGSRREGDKFMADGEGTIICLVDFDTAVVGLAEAHTSSDAELWAKANTAAIPERGTVCTVIIRPASAKAGAPSSTGAASDAMVLQLTPEGYFLYGEKILNPLELDDIIREKTASNPAQKVVLSGIPGTPAVMVKFAGRAILGSGIKAENLDMTVPEEPAASAAPTASAAPALAAPMPSTSASPAPPPSASPTPAPTASPAP